LAKKNRDNDQLSIEGTEEMEILGRLTERVDRAVELIQKLRKENESLKSRLEDRDKELTDAATARKKAEDAAAELKTRVDELEGDSGERIEEIEGELEQLMEERKAIRQRVESVLEKLESLEK
jgi:FtsZ-binding cell division protein ZapB